MKTLYKNAIIIFSAILALSCSHDELIIPDTGKDICIEYDAVLTSFSGYDVSSKQTKAAPSETAPSALDNTIKSAYFMVYGKDGARIESVKTLSLDENGNIVPHKLYHNFEKGPLTICYLVNVRKSYADSLDNLSKFADKNYAYKMSYANAGDVDGNHVGVPLLDGTPCFPMLGMMTQTYENGILSGVTVDESNVFHSTVRLRRLFSKNYFQINWTRQNVDGQLFAEQGFTLKSYSITNIPKYVLLSEAKQDENTLVESQWVDEDSYFWNPVTITSSQSTGLLEKVEFTFYVPEYSLLPEESEVSKHESKTSAEQQKFKPLLFDESKNPVYLTITGTVQSQNFVTVPLEYTIYLGEDAFSSFSLIRNNQYNNIMTITGTGDAILGNDDRVEAQYHNLADPNNTGEDNPANCYIIGRPGRYLIPMYKGNSKELLSDIDISKTVNHSDGKNSITNLKFIPDSAGRKWVMFDVNMTISNNTLTALPSIQDGNTVLEFKNVSGSTVWSWHLWFTSGGALGSEWGAISSETYSGTNATMMNRNLGASAAGEIGTYYLWGDKDPFMTPTGKGADYYGGTSTGSWSSSTKSVTDPCPPGYMVPSSKVWLSNSAWKGTTAGLDGSQLYSGAGFIYDMRDPNVLYPFASYLNNKTRVTHGLSSLSEEKVEEYLGGTYYYKDRYNLVDGLLWTSANNTALYYGVKKMQAEVSGVLYKVPILGEIKVGPTSRFWQYVEGPAAKFVEWFISKDKAVYENPGTTTVLNTSSGLQVRCVSETSTVK